MSEWHTGWTEGYASARSEAQAEILRLRAENEKLREAKHSAGERITGYIHMIEQREAEIEKLRAALKPFADEGSGNEADDDYFIYGGLTVGDLRAAAAALKETGDE